MDIVTYNCLNFKANHRMVKNLIDSNHICYFIEHWLGSDDAYLFNEICNNHSIIFSADYDNDNRRRGRPFGGKCWVLHNSIRLIEHTELSRAISKITIESEDMGKISIFGIWQPFDDGSHEKLALLQSTISILESEIEYAEFPVMLIGDFNSDFYNRNKRFDSIFLKFLNKMNLIDSGKHFNKTDFKTYKKGTYSATLDHICISKNLLNRLKEFDVVLNPMNCSDHNPVRCQIIPNQLNIPVECALEDMAKVYKFPWKNSLFTESYFIELDSLVINLMSECLSEPCCSNPRLLIDHVHMRLPLIMLKAARSAEKSVGIRTSNGLKRGRFLRCRHSDEILTITTELKRLHYRESEPDGPRLAELNVGLDIYNAVAFLTVKKMNPSVLMVFSVIAVLHSGIKSDKRKF